MNTFTGPFYKQAAFWTTIIALIVQLVIGLGYGKEAEMLGTVAATMIAYLAANGIITKASIQASANLKMHNDTLKANKK